MYQTIQLSSCVSVQGELVRMLADGRVVVRVGEREFRGHPILRHWARRRIADVADLLERRSRRR